MKYGEATRETTTSLFSFQPGKDYFTIDWRLSRGDLGAVPQDATMNGNRGASFFSLLRRRFTAFVCSLSLLLDRLLLLNRAQSDYSRGSRADNVLTYFSSYSVTSEFYSKVMLHLEPSL